MSMLRMRSCKPAFFFEGRAGGTLCIAGPRESEAPGIYGKAKALLIMLFAR